MEPPIPLPMLLPEAPFPLKELGEADEEAPLEEPLETDVCAGVSVEPKPVVDVLPVGLVAVPDLFGDNTLYTVRDKVRRYTHDSGVDVEDVEEVVLLTVAPIEKSPLVA